MDEFEVNRFMVMKFDTQEDSLLQHSVSLSLENCRNFVKHFHERFPEDEYSIVAVLDE